MIHLYKILFCNFNPRSTCNAHLGYQALGHKIKNYACEGLNIPDEKIQHDLNQLIDSFQPDFVFSYGWWKNIVNIDAFCDVLKKKGIFHVYWAIDDPVCFESISLPIAKKCDLAFTSVAECIHQYKNNGVDAYLLLDGCYPSEHTKITPRKKYSHDLVLLAHNYNVTWDPDYFSYRFNGIENIVKPIVENNYDLMVWGLWWTDSDRIYQLPEKNYGHVLSYGEEAAIYSSSKIVLGLQTVGNSKTHFSPRTFEALACGAFHLSQYSPALEEFFIKGVHMEWTKSREETLELVNFYLNHDSSREKIARAGQKEVYEKHTLLHRVPNVISIIEKFL